MGPKKKAKELVDTFSLFASDKATTENGFVYSDEIEYYNAKQCATACVDEIVEALDRVLFPNPFRQYWNKVKEEIEKL